MGGVMSPIMEKNNERMQNFQKSFNCLNRQLGLATTLATGKDRFYYYSVLAGLAIPGSLHKAHKNPAFLMPVFILGFGWAYQYDLLYGNKMERVVKEATRLLKEEPEKFAPPENNMIWTHEQVDDLFKKYKQS